MNQNEWQDTSSPEDKPPPDAARGSVWWGFWLCWGFITVWLAVTVLICPPCVITPWLGLASWQLGLPAAVWLSLFVVLNVALLAGGKSRTVRGVVLGLISSLVMSLFMLFILFIETHIR